jgi:SAM-dependent methyltransferase
VAATSWGLGDYPLMAERLEPVARRVVELAEAGPGDRVLDVACGTGNAALLAAERGAGALGIDIEPALLVIARERAASRRGAARGGEGGPGDAGQAAGSAEFREGDAAKLPLGDAAFDAVVSVFGVMYAPDHSGAARELARVTRPSGRIALAAWTPGSFMPRMGAALGPYLPPPPPGSGPPSRWGDEHQLAAILAEAGITLDSASREQLDLDAGVDLLIATAGHVLAEEERLRSEGRWQVLRDDLHALVDERVPFEYLLARAIR